MTVRSVHRPALVGIALPHLHALVRACAPEGAALHCLVFVLAVWMADTSKYMLFLGLRTTCSSEMTPLFIVRLRQIWALTTLSLIHISEPTRQAEISYAVFCLKKKNN